MLALVLSGITVLAVAAAAALSASGSPWRTAAALLGGAGATCCCLHALLVLLPGVFSVGEALVAVQAAVLVWSSAFGQLLSSDAVVANVAGSCRRFVVLLTAGSLVAAAALLPLLLWRQQAAKLGAAQRQTRSRSRAGASPAAAAVAAVGAAAVAGIALAAAAPAALWALRLAISTHRRRLLCAWWAADLAAALPIMRWLSGSGRMRGILGESTLCMRTGGWQERTPVAAAAFQPVNRGILAMHVHRNRYWCRS